MPVEAVVSVNLNFSDFFPSNRDTFSNNLRSNFLSNVSSSVAPWYESTLVSSVAGKYIGNRPCQLKKSDWRDREFLEAKKEGKVRFKRPY